MLNGWDENNLDLPRAHHFVPPDMTQKHKMVEIRTTQLQSQAFSSISNSLTQSAPPCIDETLIADEVSGIRRR
ncbi:hypothetical protein PanWU01x14_122030 [Parasponia andersonii]|uniref:Uncharacterized protein n=1 Tax=Parasponia andersonii TaxID=3476 RepID=A0A2P5CUJ3_PARAD|nr:hypothetical protein PanWU01x14_122030 [Parasponia andersonii]